MSMLFPETKVNVHIKGLGVGNFNKAKKEWDFALLRGIENHDLKVIVREYRTDAQSMKVNVYDIPNNSKKIEIKTIIDDVQSLLSVYSPGSAFSGNDLQDNNYDSRWITDLTDLHGKDVKLKKPSDPKVSLTFLSISAATLYTRNLHDAPYYIYDTTNPDNRELVRPQSLTQQPSLAAAWIGLDIKWSGTTNSTELIIDDVQKQVMSGILPDGNPDENLLRYEIEINNNCSIKDTTVSDFHYYYDHLVDSSMGQRFDEYFSPIQNTVNLRRLSLDFVNFIEVDGGKTDDCGTKLVSGLAGGLSLEEMLN